jgi:DNA invertase Pin-like site-specific DNA recombinase
VDDFVEITIPSRKTSKQRRIDEMLQTLQDSDTLVVTELSRLGRSTPEVIAFINELVSRNIRVIILKQNLDIHRSRNY